MTPEELQAIRYRLRQATKNHKWFTDGSKVCVEWYKGNSPVLAETFVPSWHEDRQMGLLEAAHNAEFIAHAPEDVSALLSEVEKVRNVACDTVKMFEQETKRLHAALSFIVHHENDYDSYQSAVEIARQALAGVSV